MTDSFDPDDVSFESIAENPDALRAAAEALVNEELPPEIDVPTDGPVTLPGGFRRLKGSSWVNVTKAWVRELNGADEERIARARLGDDDTAFVRTVLECGVERLGEDAPTKDDFEALILGDRDYLLMEIARATYGDEMEYRKVLCNFCGVQVDVTFHLSEDVPITRLDNPEDAVFDVRLSKGRIAEVVLPTVDVEADLAKTDTPAEMNTALVAHSVSEIRGENGSVTQIAGDKEAAKRLPIRDRREIITEMGKRMPGPRYDEVRFKHEPGCGEEIRLAITLADLFRGL